MPLVGLGMSLILAFKEFRGAWVLLAAAAAAVTAAAQEPTEIVEVVGRTPLGARADVDAIAANVQSASREVIERQRPLDLSQFMQRNLGGVFINEAQGNPLQPDLQYRGFVGSPLLGLPQAIAVYQDGVRLNEPFGDSVSWALLPQSAVASMVLMPGSNPLFGLNALGGAISIRTRDGFTSQGTAFEAFGGSFGRIGLHAETGGSDGNFAHFIAAEVLDEDGWRDYSPSRAGQIFGKLSWRGDRTDVALGMSLASTDLTGNGPAPTELLAFDRSQVFTRPDRTENALGLVNVSLTHDLSESAVLTGNVYARRSDIRTLNGDESDVVACTANPGVLCRDDDGVEMAVFGATGAPIAASDALIGAALNRTVTGQDGSGFALQGEWSASSSRRTHRFVAGLAYDRGSIDFDAHSELGMLDPTRLVVPGGIIDGASLTSLAAHTANVGLFVSDEITLSEPVTLALSARFNRTRIQLHDALGTALDGDHAFRQLSPAIGLTARLARGVTFYAGVSESSRAPSPVELTCADPDDPCRLPNAFLTDPPLDQVVARTFESGFRRYDRAIGWSAGIFSTTNHDDILFISAGALTNQGYFDNVGRTRRDGVELSLRGGGSRADWYVNYTFVRAWFLEELWLPSPNHPNASEVF